MAPHGTHWTQTAASAARRTLTVVAVVLGIIIPLIVLIWASDVFLTAFGGVVLGVVLRGLSDWLAAHTRLGPSWSLVVVVVVLTAAFGGLCWFFGSSLVAELSGTVSQMKQGLHRIHDYLAQRDWGRWFLHNIPSADAFLSRQGSLWAARVVGFVTTTFDILVDLLLFFAIAIYAAAQPELYIDGLVRLVPMDYRARVREFMHVAGAALRGWAFGRFLAITSVAIVVGIGLWIVGIPQPVALAFIAGVLTMVPYIGSISSVVPAALIAFLQTPQKVLYVIVVYAIAHAVENYLVAPLAQQYTVHLAPILLLVALVVIGSLFGLLGLIFAAPLTVVFLIATKMFYVEDVLGDRVSLPGSESGD